MTAGEPLGAVFSLDEISLLVRRCWGDSFSDEESPKVQRAVEKLTRLRDRMEMDRTANRRPADPTTGDPL